MTTTVSARISTRTKLAASARLEQIGATHSDLIHAAYAYLLREGRLPDAEPRTMRELSAGRRAALAQLVEETRAGDALAPQTMDPSQGGGTNGGRAHDAGFAHGEGHAHTRTGGSPDAIPPWPARDLVAHTKRRRYEALA